MGWGPTRTPPRGSLGSHESCATLRTTATWARTNTARRSGKNRSALPGSRRYSCPTMFWKSVYTAYTPMPAASGATTRCPRAAHTEAARANGAMTNSAAASLPRNWFSMVAEVRYSITPRTRGPNTEAVAMPTASAAKVPANAQRWTSSVESTPYPGDGTRLNASSNPTADGRTRARVLTKLTLSSLMVLPRPTIP
jgi:hypothetical protein